MSWGIIRGQIATLLDSISTIHEVSSTPKLKFGGYPGAYVVPSNNSGDYETNRENLRTYAFLVRLFYETKATGVASALDKLEEVVDNVLDTLDQEDLKDATSRTIGVNLPAGYTFINIFAMPSTWEEIPGEDLIFSEIKVQVRISRDVS